MHEQEGEIDVELLLFAQAADAGGVRRLDLRLPRGAAVEAMWEALGRQHPAVAAALAPWRGRCALARNRRWSAPGERLEAGDELALVPPVSGG